MLPYAYIRLTCAQWGRIRDQEKVQDGNSEEFVEALDDDSIEVHVSEVDRDPYGIMISKHEDGGASYG